MKELTDARIDQLRAEAQLLGLSGAELIVDSSNELIRRVCNGIGPSSFPVAVRERLNCLLPHIVLPALIHDLRYWYGNGTYADFQAANRELAFNARLVAWRGIAWWRIGRKVAVVWAGSRCAALCDTFGWGAYCHAIYERCQAEDARTLQ